MFDTETAPQFSEGVISLHSDSWRCLEHDLNVKVGRECAFCVQEHMTDAEFDQWMTQQNA